MGLVVGMLENLETKRTSNHIGLFDDEEVSNEFYEYFMNIAILRAKTRTNYKNQV